MASEFEFDPAPDPDLLLLAVRYVAGELGRDEEAAFELRLDEDQVAREAVAEAVELAAAIAAMGPAIAPVLPYGRRRASTIALTISGLAAAACLAWFFALPPAPAPAPRTTPSPAPVAIGHATPSETVTLAWSSLRLDVADGTDDSSELLALNDELPPPSPGEVEESSDRGLPLWLLDAASLAGRPGVGTSPAKEN